MEGDTEPGDMNHKKCEEITNRIEQMKEESLEFMQSSVKLEPTVDDVQPVINHEEQMVDGMQTVINNQEPTDREEPTMTDMNDGLEKTKSVKSDTDDGTQSQGDIDDEQHRIAMEEEVIQRYIKMTREMKKKAEKQTKLIETLKTGSKVKANAVGKWKKFKTDKLPLHPCDKTHHGRTCFSDINKKKRKPQMEEIDNISLKSEDFDTDLDDTDAVEEQKETIMRENVDIGHHSYAEACQLLGTAPIRKIREQLTETEICLQHVGLNTKDVIALTYALLQNSRVESVDLEDNRMTNEAILHVVEVLRHNIALSSLSLSDNKISPNCALVLADTLTDSTWLTHLNLSGCNLGDTGAKHMGYLMKNNISLVWLNLSHNAIGEIGAKYIGKALTINDTVEVLDLSWNHIRRMGAVTICKGLQTNSALANLNLAWNGFAYEGGIALEDALRKNIALKVLDISNNRINWEGVMHISRGLRFNGVLQILKIGCNPIAMEGVQQLLGAVKSPKSSVIHVSFEDIPINSKIQAVATAIANTRPSFSISHGAVTDSHFMIGIKKERKEDPLTLLVRYIGMMGIRIMDLFRMFDADNHALVTKANFIRGLKKIGAPISEQDMRMVARRLDRRGEGIISYSILANGVRNHMREERKEDRRQEILEIKKREHRKALLNMGYNAIKPVNFTEINMFTSAASRNLSRLLMSSSSSFSSKNESQTGKEQLRFPQLPEPNSSRSISRSTVY